MMKRCSLPVDVRVINAGKFRRYAHLTFWQHFTVPRVVTGNLKDALKVVAGFYQSIKIIHQFKPDVVFTKGGYVCLPVGLAAKFMRIPLVIHDSDTRPGLTNRILGRFADVITTGSPLENYNYPPHNSHYVGVPIADSFRPKTVSEQRKAKAAFGFDQNKPLVVAVGGGLGAVSINNAMNNAAKRLIGEGIGALVVAGRGHYENTLANAPKHSHFKVVPFVYEKMDQLLGAADIVVSRGSATFLQELAGLGKAVIVVPAHQLGDQIKNAKVFERAGAVIAVDNVGIESDDRLLQAILLLAEDPMLRQSLGQKLHDFAKPKAAQDVARFILTAAKR